MPDFLLEVGCEEIPARMIDGAGLDLRERVARLLEAEHLARNPRISHLESPRRLAVLAQGISPAQPDVTERIMGPPVSAAFENGNPTPVAHAFARKAGVELGSLERVATPKGERLAATGLFDRRYLERLVDDHASGMRDYSAPLWTLLMFEAFLAHALPESMPVTAARASD